MEVVPAVLPVLLPDYSRWQLIIYGLMLLMQEEPLTARPYIQCFCLMQLIDYNFILSYYYHYCKRRWRRPMMRCACYCQRCLLEYLINLQMENIKTTDGSGPGTFTSSYRLNSQHYLYIRAYAIQVQAPLMEMNWFLKTFTELLKILIITSTTQLQSQRRFGWLKT